jgi:hypothetical protein
VENGTRNQNGQGHLTPVENGSEHAHLTPEFPRIGSAQKRRERCRFGRIEECDRHKQWKPDAHLQTPPCRDGESLDEGDSQGPDEEMAI